MANRNYPSSRVFGWHLMPVRLDLSVPIGSTGAVGTISGKGIKAVTRLSAGIYQIQFQDNYASFLSAYCTAASPVTGSAIPGGSFVTSTVYQIVSLGTTTQAQWVTAGVPSGITATPGVVFKAAGAGAGSGTVKAIGTSATTKMEIVGDPSKMLSYQPAQSNTGCYLTVQFLGPTDASTTTPIPTDPASGSTLFFEFYFNNSSVQ